MAVEGVNSNSTLIQGTQPQPQQSNPATENEGLKPTENNTEQENTNTTNASANQDSETTNESTDPGTLLDVLA